MKAFTGLRNTRSEFVPWAKAHYNSLAPHQPAHPNIYAVNIAHTLAFRYVSYDANRLILRPHALEFPIELVKLTSDQSPSAAIVGRVCIAITEL